MSGWMFLLACNVCVNIMGSRPFTPPVFDRLQYAKAEGGGRGGILLCTDLLMRNKLQVGKCSGAREPTS